MMYIEKALWSSQNAELPECFFYDRNLAETAEMEF